MNKKQLYESIMKDVSKVIKKHLNEQNEKKTKVEEVADILMNDLKKAKKDLEFAIDFMKIISKGREDKTYYKGVSYSKLIPELESRLK